MLFVLQDIPCDKCKLEFSRPHHKHTKKKKIRAYKEKYQLDIIYLQHDVMSEEVKLLKIYTFPASPYLCDWTYVLLKTLMQMQ